MTDVKQLITEHLDIWLTAETEKKSGRGRSSGSNDTIYGVQKLRDLILELAVIGKLTDQNSSENNVDQVLKDALSIKALQVVSRKTTKKNSIELDLSNNDIPLNWRQTHLENLVEVLNGRAYKKNELLDAGTPVLRVGNLFTSDHWYYSNLELEDNKYCNNGDLLFAWSASFGPVIWTGEKVIYHYHIWKLSLFSENTINKEYLYLYLLQQTKRIKNAGHGVMLVHLTKEKMEKLVVNVPPLEEQQRIVEKVDELMQLCDQLEQQQTLSSDAHATLVDTVLKALTESSDADEFQDNWQRIVANFDVLFTTEHSIEQLKQTVLQLAVMGKLVKQDPSDEPASELLKKIADEKAKLIKEGKIKKSKPLPEIAEDEKPFELSSGWEWEKLGNISLINSGNAFSSQDFTEEDGLHRVIKITNIGVGEFIESSDYLNIELNKKIEAFQVFQDDLLLALTRPYISTGLKICKCPQSYDKSLLNQRVSMIRPFEIGMNEYIYLFMRSDFVLNLYKKRFSDSGLQPNLKMEDVTNLVIPLPPLIEQKYIIEKVNQLFSMIDQLQVLHSKLQKTKLHLADALVANAVEGV